MENGLLDCTQNKGSACEFTVAASAGNNSAIKFRSVSQPQFYLAIVNGYTVGYVSTIVVDRSEQSHSVRQFETDIMCVSMHTVMTCASDYISPARSRARLYCVSSNLSFLQVCSATYSANEAVSYEVLPRVVIRRNSLRTLLA